MVAAVCEGIKRLGRKERRDDFAVKEAASQALRRAVKRQFGKKPVTAVHLIRLY